MSYHSTIVEYLARWPQRHIDFSLSDPCAERVRNAVESLLVQPESVGPGDLAGLIGHWLKREAIAGRGDRVRVPRGTSWPAKQRWQAAGLSIVMEDESSFLLGPGAPWTPDWLPGSDTIPPLEDAFHETRRRLSGNEHRPPADPCLSDVLGQRFSRFTGPGQREAVRAAFLIPPGETLLVVLPTGAGKSLVGLAPALLGWPARGLTLVVVPTVALAHDLAHQARELLGRGGADTTIPLAWHAQLPESERQFIKRAIRDGRQPILFASPEAVLQALSPALFDAAEIGLLRSLVIDEAHLVAQWGSDFRPEFQSLAGVREELLKVCPAASRFRTTLLTATLTSESFGTLRTLFGSLHVVSAVHLRPEPTYWVSRALSESEQRLRVREACRRMPRPFLLYVTQRRHAEEWAAVLREDGLRRVRFVHGGSTNRAAVLDLWRANQIDVVVATSAFGLGMDKGDVRAVLHACVPETVDRYYQEVGRGGRDGNACVSITVYTDANFDEAQRLNTERVITPKLGLERWKAMFNTRPAGSERHDLFAVDLRAKRANVVQDNDANVGWNLQTLNLMARAGLLKLHAARPPEVDREPNETPSQFETRMQRLFDDYFATARVETLGGVDHRDPAVWDTLVQAERKRTADAGGDQLDLLRAMLEGRNEFGDALEQVYSVADASTSIGVEAVCGGCPVCRSERIDRSEYVLPLANLPPMRRRMADARLVAATGLGRDAEFAVVVYPPVGDGPRPWRRWNDLVLQVLLPRLIDLGVRQIAASASWAERPEYRQLYRRCPERYILHTDVAALGIYDDNWPVPQVTLLDPASPPPIVSRDLIRLSRPFHLLLIPHDARDPNFPHEAYRDRNPTTPLESLLNRLDR